MRYLRRIVVTIVAVGTVVGLTFGISTVALAAPGSAQGVAAKKVNCKVKKCVAITYDDGPGAFTGQLLDVLKKRKAKATFFVLGSQAASYPKLVAREIAEGHQVVNHSWSHPDLTRLSDKEVRHQIKRTAKKIKQLTGIRPRLVRPPYGSVNARILKIMKDGGWPAIMWNVDTLDWQHHSASKVVGHVRNDTHRGSIILMHDIQDASVDAANDVITTLRKQGYTLVTVDTLLGTKTKGGKVYYNR